MADIYTTLQLATPCTLTEVNAWFEEVNRVMSDGVAEVSVVAHTNGTYRLTVHLQEQT